MSLLNNLKLLRHSCNDGLGAAIAEIERLETRVAQLEAGVGVDIPGDTTTKAELLDGDRKSSDISGWYDRDWYVVEMRAGEQWEFEMLGSVNRDGSLADPKLILFNMDRRPVALNDNGGVVTNARIVYTCPQTGLYYLQCSDSTGKHDGTYTVTAKRL